MAVVPRLFARYDELNLKLTGLVARHNALRKAQVEHRYMLWS